MVFTPGFLSLATASPTIWSQALPYSSRGANENKTEISVQSYCHKKTLPIQKETKVSSGKSQNFQAAAQTTEEVAL